MHLKIVYMTIHACKNRRKGKPCSIEGGQSKALCREEVLSENVGRECVKDGGR